MRAVSSCSNTSVMARSPNKMMAARRAALEVVFDNRGLGLKP